MVNVRSRDKTLKSKLTVGVGANGELSAFTRCDHDGVGHRLARRSPDSADEGGDCLLSVQRGGAKREAQDN